MKELYWREEEAGNNPFLLFCGDLVHGPNHELHQPGAWPDYLGTPYQDESAKLICDYLQFSSTARTCALLGNHEHAHVGGPKLSKFHLDEAQVLEDALGQMREEIRFFLRGFPLVASTECGAMFTHAAPAASEPTLEAFEDLQYEPYQPRTIQNMFRQNTVGTLLWARHATDEQAKNLLETTSPENRPHTFCVYGHDIVDSGYRKTGSYQICLSSSYGVFNKNKTYLRLDLSHHYAGLQDIREGHELLPLYPEYAKCQDNPPSLLLDSPPRVEAS